MLRICLGCLQASQDSGMDGQWDYSHSTVGHSGHVQDVPGLPRDSRMRWRALPVGCSGHVRDRQWDCSHLEWDTWDVSGMSLCFLGLWTVGLEPPRVGHLGHVRDVHASLDSGIRCTVGFDPQQCDMSGLLWTLDCGIGALHSGTLGTCLGCP